ncbi:MAG: cytochrome P450 [Chloroflexi bacterium]|nr:cytochrome P450 [Chloroflexota bacterium]
MPANNLIPSMDMASAAFKANPFPFYAQLRAEAPVYRLTVNRPADNPLWIITRYGDVAAVLKDERFVKDLKHALPPDQLPKSSWRPAFFHLLDNNMLAMDAPEHTRLRGFIHKIFTTARVEQMRLKVEQLAGELLDTATKNRHFDLIEHYALPIPLITINEVLGIPREDYAKIYRWKKGLMAAAAHPLHRVGRFANFLGFAGYIRKLCHMRRVDPRNDLISALALPDENGDRLSDAELEGMVVLLLVAGHETAVSLISSGTLALLEHPDQSALLRHNPMLVKSATEEILRYYPPIETATDRYAREAVTIEGVTIPRGGQVRAVIAAANRDPSQFENPETFSITRETNKHLSFGQGIHYCMGTPLARLEGHVAFNTLLARLPDLRLDVPVESLRWRSGLTFRRLETLPVTF